MVYPKTHVDFDAEFLFYIVEAVFSKTELKPVMKDKPSPRVLNKAKLSFVKGNIKRFDLKFLIQRSIN